MYALSRDFVESAGYGATSTRIWRLYGTESEKYDKALVDSWMSDTDSMLIFVRSIYLIITPPNYIELDWSILHNSCLISN